MMVFDSDAGYGHSNILEPVKTRKVFGSYADCGFGAIKYSRSCQD